MTSFKDNLGISGSGLGRRLYAQQDGNWNLTALLDTGGAVRERFVCDPYGNVQALDAGGNSATDGYGWAYLHQGGRLEPATGLYYFRHRDYSPGMGRWVEEDPLTYVAGSNMYGYVRSAPNNGLDPSGTWDAAGHFWITYMSAIAAGMSPNKAYELAYYSQLPDEISFTDAYTLWKEWRNMSFLQNVTGELPREEIDATTGWMKDVYDQLHQLHGGNAGQVTKRRQCLKDLIQNGNLEPWEKGFVIHAFGDSYAHTDPNGNAYGFPWGHGRDVHYPDKIANRPLLAANYAYNLYLALGGAEDMSSQQLRQMRTVYANLSMSPDAEVQIGWMMTVATDYFGFDFNPYVPNTQFRSPSMMDVQRLMDKMKRKCGCAAYNQ